MSDPVVINQTFVMLIAVLYLMVQVAGYALIPRLVPRNWMESVKWFYLIVVIGIDLITGILIGMVMVA